MEKIKSGLRAVWKTVYPLMAYYMSVFSVGGNTCFRRNIEPPSSVLIILLGAILTAGILWFPYKRDWILRSGQIRTFRPQIPKDWHHLIIFGDFCPVCDPIFC